jgi:predicted  nucleic acid-binding Zn-ribbon protein
LRDDEVLEYQRLSRESRKAVKEVKAELGQNKASLEKALKEVAELNGDIASLRKDNVDFRERMQLIKLEEEKLKNRVAMLIGEKTVLEKKLVFFKERIYSIDELKAALKIAKIKRRQQRRAERVQSRLTKIAMRRKLDELAMDQGNKGYVVKGGRTTFGPKTTIRVELEAIEDRYYK